MKALKFNADYELALSGKEQNSSAINQSLEFLIFFLEEKPLLSSKVYSQEYLDHVEKISGIKPKVVRQGEYENWWGKLDDISLERKLNSKAFLFHLTRDILVDSSSDISGFSEGESYLLKRPLNMSGQGSVLIENATKEKVLSFFKPGEEIVLSPFKKRVRDFSHYILPHNEIICYENFIDHKFQYNGTLFRNIHSARAESLRFFNDLDEDEWKKFFIALKDIMNVYLQEGIGWGYSIDSFTYLEHRKLCIQAACEVNYRKTMGLLTWMLAKKYSHNNSWCLLVLGKALKRKDAFSFIQKQLTGLEGVIHLSPGNTRFEIFFLTASSKEQGIENFKALKKLLPGCKFAVDI